jgi:hypothetical protein
MGQGSRCLSESGVVDLLSGALESAERRDLEHHLDGCARCAQFIGEAANETGRPATPPAETLRPALLAPGTIIADRYHVRRLLGTGAMGEVHEVEDRLMGTMVALKTLNARLAGDTRALARLKREVAAARLVTHANVCRIFDLGIDRDRPELDALVFLTMEYLPGVTLSRFLRPRPLSPTEALPLLIQLADGLGAAHAAGILHRDLKTENVMLVDQGDGGRRAVIMDFGLASFSVQDDTSLERGSGSGFSGTIAYAAPERMTGGRATAASDVYALGLIAREMLTGRSPALTGRPAALPAELGPRVARRWEELLGRATHAAPVARFANGGALADALRLLGRKSARPPARARPLALGLAAAAIIPAMLWLPALRGPAPAPVATAVVALPRPPRAAAATMVADSGQPPVTAVYKPGGDLAGSAPRLPERVRKRRPGGDRVAVREAVTAPAVAAPPAAHPADDLVRELRRAPAEDDFALADPFHR